METNSDRIPEKHLEIAANVLKVIAHPKRLRINELLIQHKQLKVNDLAELMDTPPNTISQHLKLLKAYNIVDSRREGRYVYYISTHPAAATMLSCIRKNSGRFA